MDRKGKISRFGHLDSFNTLLSLALLTLLIDCLAIHGRGTQRGATGMIETPQESQGVMQGGVDAPGTLILQEPSARTNFQGQNVRKEGFPAPQDVLTLISTMYLKSIKPSTPEEFNAFIIYMEKVRQVIVVDKKSGSLKKLKLYWSVLRWRFLMKCGKTIVQAI